ncbi:MAG: protein kinase [archaeon]|nr:protein kinase [archaeon]
MDKVEKVDLNELIKDFRINDIDTFSRYLIEIWRDLAHRSSEDAKGLEKLTFINYYDLPGIISDRLFAVLDKNSNGTLDPKEFIEGMITLFSEGFKKQAQFIFKFYDFDKDGFITKEDVRVVLSYVPLQLTFKKNKMRFEQEEFKDRVDSQNELYNILNTAFGKKEKLNEEEFMTVVDHVSSDIFIFILMFLLERRPFTDDSIKMFIKTLGDEAKSIESISRTPKLDPHKIASPSMTSKFVSPTLKKRALKNQTKSVLSLYSMNQPSDTTASSMFKKKEAASAGEKKPFKEDLEGAKGANEKMSQPNRKKRKMLGALEENPAGNAVGFSFSSVAANAEKKPSSPKKGSSSPGKKGGASPKSPKKGKGLDYESDEEELREFNSTSLIKHEGYMYKLTHTQKLKKVYFILIGRDFYYFKSKEDLTHKGMHNLSGIFINKGEPTDMEGKHLYNFSILYPQKARTYYMEDEAECERWLEKLNRAINYKSLSQQYEIKEKAGKGKFGLVKIAMHKDTGRKVAIKIMARKDMTASDLELAKTEMDILKVCQHPNIIKLYDVYDSPDYIYLVMEYCGGGDLFSYIEKRGYKLPEPKACEIIHKLSMAIFYIHSYGIVHRDLKPENILMTDTSDNADIRLLDFGLSKIIGPTEKCREPYGTLSYVAPEVLKEKPYGKEVDLWSIGIITYLLLCGFLPFDDENSEREIARQTIQDPVPYPSQVWSKLSPEAKNFVDGLLKKKPEERMSITQVLEHDWIKKFSKIPNERLDAKKKGNFFSLYATAH